MGSSPRHDSWKRDRRDARKLAELLRAGLLTEVHPPSESDEALRDLPSESSSDERERRGAITKTGNRHVRRLLVKAGWHHRHRPALSGPLRARRQGQPARVLAIGDRAHERLYARYRRMGQAGKILPTTIVAVARELSAYLWAVLHPAAAPTRLTTLHT